MKKPGKNVRTEGDSEDSEDDNDLKRNEWSLNQKIFFTDGGRTVKVSSTRLIHLEQTK